MDDAYCAIASRLHTRLEALFDQPYPAYAMACRPSLDTASPLPLAEVVATAAGDKPGDEDAVPRETRSETDASRTRSAEEDAAWDLGYAEGREYNEGGYDAGQARWDAGYAAGQKLFAKYRSNTEAQKAIDTQESHAEQDRYGKKGEALGKQALLWELELFLREPRECYGVWTHIPPSQPLREWLDVKEQSVEAELDEHRSPERRSLRCKDQGGKPHLPRAEQSGGQMAISSGDIFRGVFAPTFLLCYCVSF